MAIGQTETDDGFEDDLPGDEVGEVGSDSQASDSAADDSQGGEPVDSASSEFEPFSERELAIALGEDPDEAQQANDGSSDEGTEAPAGFVSGDVSEADATPAESSDAAAKGGSGPAWITKDIESIAEGFGLTREQIETFANEAQFHATMRLVDQAAFGSLLAEKEAASQEASERAAQQPNQPPSQPAKQPAIESDGKGGLKRVDRNKYVEEGYDDSTLALVDALNEVIDRSEKMESVYSKVAEERAEIERAAAINRFHDEADLLNEKIFGRSLDKAGRNIALGQEHNRNREMLYAGYAYVKDMFQKAVDGGKLAALPSERVMMQRAAYSVFGQQLVNSEVAARDQRISDQSRRRRPAGARPIRPNGGGGIASGRSRGGLKSDDEMLSDVANDKDVLAAWERFQDANGN